MKKVITDLAGLELAVLESWECPRRAPDDSIVWVDEKEGRASGYDRVSTVQLYVHDTQLDVSHIRIIEIKRDAFVKISSAIHETEMESRVIEWDMP